MKMRTSKAARTALTLLLVIGTFSGSLPTAVPLDAADLAAVTGSGFWNDPCTWDGFAVGAGTVLMAAGHPSGFVSVFSGLVKAIYVDDCF